MKPVLTEDNAQRGPCGDSLYQVRILERGTGRLLFSDDKVDR